MGTINPCRAFWALLLTISLCAAQSSVPVATEPIVTAVTVSTVVPSLLTVYSVITTTQTDSTAEASTVTTVIDGQQTTILASASGEANAQPAVAQTITSTIISTISVTTSQVVQSTIGYSTILGADSSSVTTSNTAGIPASSATAVATSLIVSTDGAGSVSTFSTGDVLASTSSAGTVTSQLPISSSSTASGAAATSSNSATSSTKGLSSGAKAGIGIGVAIGVAILVVLAFLLGQRFSRRRNARGAFREEPSDADIAEKDTFQAGRPYELTGSKRQPIEMSTGKMHPYSFTTTEGGSGSESVSGKSYEMPGSAVSKYGEPTELSALPQFGKDDAPMYVGVPAHMSGSKRWSMKEYEKH